MTSLKRRLKRVRPLLGTFVEIELAGAGSDDELNARLTEGFDAISNVDRLMSYHRANSDLSRVNKSEAGTWVNVHPFTVDVFEMSNALFLVSDGAFDIRCGAVLAAWGLLPVLSKPGRFTAANAPDVSPGFPLRGTSPGIQAPEKWQPEGLPLTSSFGRNEPPLEIDGRRARKTGPWTLDLGGIAKGYAVDRAVNVLERFKNLSGLVNAGGDLRAFGKKKWPVSIRHPRFTNRSWPFFDLREGAIATSGIYFSRKRVKNNWVSPIVDPKDSRPFLKRGSVTVLSDSCAVADALTKVAALRPGGAAKILNQFKSRAFTMAPDGAVRSFN